MLKTAFMSLILMTLCEANDLAQVQRQATAAMRANSLRMRISAENMANAKSPDYTPKAVVVGKGKNGVVVKDVIQQKNKTRQVFDPNHPQADTQGMVTLPDIDPLITLMDLQQTRLDNERVMKVYQMATDQRHRILSMMNH